MPLLLSHSPLSPRPNGAAGADGRTLKIAKPRKVKRSRCPDGSAEEECAAGTDRRTLSIAKPRRVKRSRCPDGGAAVSGAGRTCATVFRKGGVKPTRRCRKRRS